MLVSRFIVDYLQEKGVRYVFGVTGTTVNMCFVALGEKEGIDYVCPLHEQTASMGADGYSRISNDIGVAIGTSGPGTSNMATGCAGAFFDSIPVLYIVGQTSINNSKQNNKIRHFGFQELDSESLFRPITKYVNTVANPLDTRYELDKAIYIAKSNRKGPVMLIFPENVLYADVDSSCLSSFIPIEKDDKTKIDYQSVIELIKDSKKPLLLFGAGIHSSGAESIAREFVKKTSIPFALTYPARDLIDTCDSLNVGSIGIFGSQYGNLAVQNVDLIISIGARMDRYVTGSIPSNFAPHSKKILVDIDQNELNKQESIGISIDVKVLEDAKTFLTQLSSLIKPTELDSCSNWKSFISDNKIRYPLCETSYYDEKTINPYVFIKKISNALKCDDFIFTDTGLSAVWVGQSFEFKTGQRWFTQFSYSSMGYGLSASIGGSFATDNRVICITGDGGLQMSVQDLATIDYYKKPLKIFVICNGGYGLIQKTQDDFNNGHHATDRDNHVPMPNLKKQIKAYGIKLFEIHKNTDAEAAICKTLDYDGPAVCLVYVPITKRITPRIRGSKKLDEMFPYYT